MNGVTVYRNMNNTLKLIDNRKSVRTYLDKEIPREYKDRIIESAMRAPTAGNMMLYSIIEVDEQNLKDKLAVSCDNQPFIAQASLVLLFLADYQRWNDYFIHSGVPSLMQEQGESMRTPEEGDLMLACNDALIAAQTSVIASESMGIGSCYIGDIMENYEYHRDLFDLPDYTFPVTLLCFGYPNENYTEKKPAARFERQYIHFRNKYKRLTPEEFDSMYSPLKKRYFSNDIFIEGASNIGQHFYLRKHSSLFMKEMNRSVRAAMKAWSKNGS